MKMAEITGAQESTPDLAIGPSELGALESSRHNRHKYCSHCNCVVPNTTFYRHRQLFYDEERRTWSNVRLRESTISATPELQGESFMDTIESDSTNQITNQEVEDLTTDQEMHDSAPQDSLYEDSEDEKFFESEDDDESLEEDVYQELWTENDFGSSDVQQNPANQENTVNPILRLFFLQLILWQMIFRVSDSAIKAIVAITKKVFYLLGGQLNYGNLNNACDHVPNSYHGLLKFVGLDTHNLKVFVVCPSCNSIYDYSQCVTTRAGREVPLTCRSVAFPNHPHRDQRQPCNTPLLKEVKVQDSGKTHYVPVKTFPYQSLKTAITDLVADPSILTICDHWRKRSENVPGDILADVYDGAIWRDFNSDKYFNFLKFPGNFLLSLNTDWFQPFTRTQYSVGVLYLVVLNLPRNQRYKMENVILCGIIPGPREPRLTMNSFIGPLVKELNDAYRGWTIPTKHPILKTVCVRLCIGSVVCDIPATRKLYGFLGHSARFGCNKCLKEFPTESFGRKPDYSGYNRSDWVARTKDHHKSVCSEWLKCKTKSARDELESQSGIRYSILIDLPLFDPVSFVVIDPMHNLLLGTAKHVMSIWTKTERLTQQDLQVIQGKTALLKFPYDVGRIPIKIASSFSGFTADQWRTWTTIISPIVLKGVLPIEDLNCWLLFVNACRLMLTRVISLDTVSQADNYLVLFCRTFQRLYGNYPCSPNQHLHMHLKDCFLNFGPVHAFWAFAFERHNGLLGTYHTNNRNIEEQIMLKFLRHQKIKRLSSQDNISDLLDSDHCKGSMSETVNNTDHADVLSMVKLSSTRDLTSVSFQFVQSYKPLPPIGEKVLSRLEVSQLQSVYAQLYPEQPITFFSLFYLQCKKVLLGDEMLGTGEVIMAYWPGSGSSLNDIDYSACRVGSIKYFLRHYIKLNYNETDTEHLFCFVTWKQKHPMCNWFGKSAIVSSTLNEVESGCCFVPIQRLAFRCASGELPVDFGHITERVLVASPVSMKFCI